MEKLKMMKEQLMSCVQTQMGNLHNVDAKELGEAVDMIKDLEEAIYYCTITEAMNDKKENKQQEHHYYTERIIQQPREEYDRRYMMPYPYRDMDRPYGKMYYNGNGNGTSGGSTAMSGNTNSSMSYTEMPYPYPLEMRDSREGRSPMSRKSYMESKEMHKDKAHQMKELEGYLSELSKDVIEMIEDASPEEQQYLEKKISQLANKIGRISTNG